MSRLLVPLMLLSAAWASAQTVWVASPWEHVLKTSDPGTNTTARLQSAANEYEPFRIIVRAGEEALPEVDLKASGLKGPKGTISARHLTLYREHYLNVFAPSMRSTASPGWYPDALIPFVDPVSGKELVGAKYEARPYSIEPGANQGYWVDVYVPKGTEAGSYAGTVTVTSAGKPVATVAVSLEVWGFALPDTIAMESCFGSLGNRIAKKNNLPPGSVELAEVEDLYIDAFLAHRAVPGSLGNIWPKVSEDGSVDDSETGERLHDLVVNKHVNALRLPFSASDPVKCKRELRAYANYLRQKGWLELAYVYMKDEPNSAEDYEIVRKQGALIREADPAIRRMCTEQTVTSKPEWGDLYGAVDVWCPLWGLWDEPTAEARLALGETLWSYTALCQREAPFWQVDFAPVHFRSPFWISWWYDVKGFLYWSSVYWDPYEDVWNKPHFRDRYWGEGMLVYPGGEAGMKGPVPSIRLKLVREALEDYEYMTLAAKQGQEERVDRIVNSVVQSFQVWDRDAEEYYRARERLARLIK